MWSVTCYFFVVLYTYTHTLSRVSPEIKLFLCLDFSPWYLQVLLLSLLLTASSLVGHGWQLPDWEPHPHCTVFTKRFLFLGSSSFHSSLHHSANGVPRQGFPFQIRGGQIQPMDHLVLQIKFYQNTPCQFVDLLSVTSLVYHSKVEQLHQTGWLTKPGPVQEKIAYSVLDHHSTVMISFPSPFTRDTFSTLETHIFTSFIIAYEKFFSYFTERPASIHFKLGDYKASPKVLQSVSCTVCFNYNF